LQLVHIADALLVVGQYSNQQLGLVGSEFDFAGVLLWAGEVTASKCSWQPLA
jgi:hypothetical protein